MAFLFLNLPRELRDEVYKYLIEVVRRRVPIKLVPLFFRTLGIHVPFLQTCRQMQEEAEYQMKLLRPQLLPPPTLILDLAEGARGWIVLFHMLRCIDQHMATDRQRPLLTANPRIAPFDLNRRIDWCPEPLWTSIASTFSIQGYFNEFFSDTILQLRQTNVIELWLTTTPDNTSVDVFFLTQLLATPGQTLVITLHVWGSSAMSKWTALLADEQVRSRAYMWKRCHSNHMIVLEEVAEAGAAEIHHQATHVAVLSERQVPFRIEACAHGEAGSESTITLTATVS